MLEVSTGIVCRIIDLAREFQAQEGVVIPATSGGSEIDSDAAMQILAAHADDLTYQQLKAEIDDLEQRQQIELVALTWLGRGDYTAEEWEDVREQAGEQWTSHTAEYLLATPQIAEYLADGLEQLGFSCAPD